MIAYQSTGIISRFFGYGPKSRESTSDSVLWFCMDRCGGFFKAQGTGYTAQGVDA